MVFLQGTARRDSPSAACLRLFESGHITLYVSQPVLFEIEDVLSRPRLRQKFPVLTSEVIAKLTEVLCQKAILVSENIPGLRYKRDPKDEPYLNLALAAKAQFLVTWDKDLLDLGRSDNPEGSAFRTRLPNLQFLDPVAFLAVLESLTGKVPSSSK